MSDKLTVPAESLPVAHGGDVLTIIQRIVDSGLTAEAVSAVEKLLNMQERIMADQRKTAFMAAMSRLQAKLPQISKYGQGKNSKFAKLEDVDRVIRPLLAEEGFSFSFDEEAHTDKTITFRATVSHCEGHAESKTLTVPIDVAAKNASGNSVRPAIQDAGSTVSYARRYLIKMMLNIVETDEDTDGHDLQVISAEQEKDLEALLLEVKGNREFFYDLFQIKSFSELLARDLPKAIRALEMKRKAQK